MKIFLLSTIAFFLLVFPSSQSFAEEIISTSTIVGGQGFTPSNGVNVWIESHPENGYAAYSWHSSGNRQFGTDSRESKIYWRDGNNLLTPSLSERISTNFVWPSDWAAL